jgi:hypothetical protein
VAAAAAAAAAAAFCARHGHATFHLLQEMNAVHFGTKAACHQMTEIVQRCWFENVCWPTEQDRTTQVSSGIGQAVGIFHCAAWLQRRL